MDRKLMILIGIATLWVAPMQAQHPEVRGSIMAEVTSALTANELRVDNELLTQDLAYSIQLLSDIADTLTSKLPLHRLSYYLTDLRDHVHNSNNEVKTKYISSLIALVKNPLVEDPEGIVDLLYLKFSDEFNNTHIDAMRDTLFFRGISWRMPLLIAKLELASEIPNLKRWAQNPRLDWIHEYTLNAALARLGDEETIHELLTLDFNLGDDQKDYLELRRHMDILNYARQRETTDKMFQYLYDDRAIILEEFSDGYREFGKVSGLSLTHLELMVQDFPVKVQFLHHLFNRNYKEKGIEEKVTQARAWYEKNKYNYSIIKSVDNLQTFR